ncbi:hypothetical protein [Nitrospirillum sp. BR 11828]|uniref:hypothetical protein n=1 Tax=Nitrospirillum sp. BR 11828 TaxID=3104325 RepID=UPI002ACA1F51|nr:hypothetical protein [Nitrospirillum sp. BR 11828]MDZ5646426.1 hypothetical protein [Nitrospirillum sp. BR 11828]
MTDNRNIPEITNEKIPYGEVPDQHVAYTYESGTTLATFGKFYSQGEGRNAIFSTVILPDGTTHRVQIDTGSCGIVLPASLFHDPAGNLYSWAIPARPFHMTYEPSGDVVAGHIYAIESVAFETIGGPNLQTGWVYVLGTDKGNPGMCGIGFGRADNKAMAAATAYPNCVPEVHETRLMGADQPVLLDGDQAVLSNPLLNIVGMANGTVPANYVITSMINAAVTVGIDANDLAKFNFLQLSSQLNKHITLPQNAPYYATPDYQATLTQYNGGSSFSIPALMDTGVDCMMIRIPPGGNGGKVTGWTSGYGWTESNLLGQTLSITVPNPDASGEPIMSYSFHFGKLTLALPPAEKNSDATVIEVSAFPAIGSTKMAPSVILPLQEKSPDAAVFFVNTGINVLANYDYCFDANNGRVGYRAALMPYDNSGIQNVG